MDRPEAGNGEQPQMSGRKERRRGTGIPLLRPAPRQTVFHRLRGDFLTGVVVVAPLVITAYLAWTFVNFVDNSVIPFIPDRYNPQRFLPIHIPGLGVVVFVIATTIIGALTKNIIGRTLLLWSESLLHRMPVVRSVYNAVKQIAETALSQSQSSFRTACLVQYPRQGIWAVAFISTETGGEILRRVPEEEMVSVFLPTTPNPTSGFLLFVPKRDVIILDMTVEQAAKLVISAGLVDPEAVDAGRGDPQVALEGERPGQTATAAAQVPQGAPGKQSC